MSWKQLSQSSLADSLASHHKSLEELDDIHELLDWSRIEAHLRDMFSSKRGEPAWPPLLMFKIMLLQQWYRLSDEGMEKQLARDLLFRRFTGLGLSDGTPDHTVIWRFHKLIGKLKLAEVLFEEINQQLCEQNIMIRAGGVSIIDATIIEAKNSRPKNGKSGENTQDKDAAYTSKKVQMASSKPLMVLNFMVTVMKMPFYKNTPVLPPMSMILNNLRNCLQERNLRLMLIVPIKARNMMSIFKGTK